MRRPSALFPWLAALLSFLAFLPALDGSFQDFDDAANIVENPEYRGLGLARLRWMFTAFLGGHYIPVTWMSFGLDYHLYGMAPWGYHLTNLLLHSANAALVFFLAKRLLAAARPEAPPLPLDLCALFAALHLGIHPLRAESVCWVTERRDVLCGLFFLGSALFHLRRLESEGRGGGGPSIALFALALLSKVSALALPFMLLAADLTPLKRVPTDRPLLRWEPWAPLVREKLPYLALSAAAALIAFVAQSHQATGLIPLTGHGLASRLVQSCYGLVFYVRKSLWPGDLSPMVDLLPPLSPLAPAFAASLLAAAAALAWAAARLRRGKPGLACAAFAYAAMVFPVLGFFQNGAQLVADRYSYLACLPWTLLAAGWLLASRARRLAAVLCAAYLLALGCRAYAQARLWRDPVVLWDHALALDPLSPRSNEMRALAAVQRRDWATVVRTLERCESVRPVFVLTRSHWCSALVGLGRWDEAAAKCGEVLRALPGSDPVRRNLARAHNNLCAEALKAMRFAEAEDRCRSALSVLPEHPSARRNLCGLLTLQGRRSEAKRFCRAGGPTPQ